MRITGKKTALCILVSLSALLAFQALSDTLSGKQYIKQIESLRQSGKPGEALKLIKNAPPNVEQQVISWLELNTQNLEPLYLLLLADKQAKNNPQEAAKWFYASGIRARYDALRCIDTSAREGVGPTTWSLLAPNAAASVSTLSTMSRLDSIQAALDWDQTHPESYSPLWICYHGIQAFSRPPSLVSRDQWLKIQKENREGFMKGLSTARDREAALEKLEKNKVLISYGMILHPSNGNIFRLSENNFLLLDTHFPVKQFQTYDQQKATSEASGRFIIAHGEGGNSAVQLQNHQILLFGGASAPLKNEPLYLFDPATQEERKIGELNHLRQFGTATLLKDGTILFAGGQTASIHYENKQKTILDPGTDQAERYDPASNRSMPVGVLNHPRIGHAAIRLDDNRVLIVGGEPPFNNQKPKSEIDTQTIEAFDPRTQTFRVIGKLNQVFGQHPLLTKLSDGRVLILGHAKEGGLAELFDPVSGQSVSLSRPDAYWNAEHSSATLLPDGRVLIFGPDPYGKGTSSLWFFEPKGKQFSLVAKIPPQRLYTSLYPMQDGKVLLFGGTKDVLLFDPSAWDNTQTTPSATQ